MSLGGVFKTIGRVVAMPVTKPAKAIKRGAQKTMQAAIAGILRHVLTALGGGLVASGTLSGDDLNAAIGAITTLVGIGWSVFSKRKAATA